MGDMTLADFEAELKVRGFDGYSSVERYRYIQWGYEAVVRLLDVDKLSVTESVALSAGDYQADLTTELTNVSSIDRVSINVGNGKNLQLLAEWDFLDNWLPLDLSLASLRGTPLYYTVYQNKLWILPPPDTAYTIKVTHYKAGEKLDTATPSSTTPLTPRELDPAILSGALAWCHKRANQWELALAEEQFMEKVALEYLAQQEFQESEGDTRFKVPDPAWAGELGGY